MNIQVSSASPEQHAGIIDILTDSFAQDPAFLRMIPQPDQDNQKLRALFELQIRRQYGLAGTIDVATNGDKEIVGVALWDAPDGRHGLRDQAAILPELVQIFGRHTASVVLAELSAARYHPRFPHWYLYTIASVARARGTGVGSALLNHGLQRAGEEAIYLEATTTRAAKLYHRLGFVPLGHIPNREQSAPELAMWKPPALP